MSQQPVNKWIQAIFWPLSVLPSFQHIPKHSADDYVGRTSPLLATALAFWIVAIATIIMALILNGVLDWNVSGIDEGFGVAVVFTIVIYIAGFWMFASREDVYPN